MQQVFHDIVVPKRCNRRRRRRDILPLSPTKKKRAQSQNFHLNYSGPSPSTVLTASAQHGGRDITNAQEVDYYRDIIPLKKELR